MIIRPSLSCIHWLEFVYRMLWHHFTMLWHHFAVISFWMYIVRSSLLKRHRELLCLRQLLLLKFLWSYWYPCFGLMVMSALKTRMNFSFAYISGATLADLLTVNMAASHKMPGFEREIPHSNRWVIHSTTQTGHVVMYLPVCSVVLYTCSDEFVLLVSDSSIVIHTIPTLSMFLISCMIKSPMNSIIHTKSFCDGNNRAEK